MRKILFAVTALIIASCCTHKPTSNVVQTEINDSIPVEGKIEYVLIKDSTDSLRFANELDAVISKYECDLTVANEKIDSLKKVTDSLNVKLFDCKYRLNKIEEYNKIAAKGNNIKYLRGWLNRALDGWKN